MSKAEIREVRHNAEDRFLMLLMSMKASESLSADFGALGVLVFLSEEPNVARPWTMLIGMKDALSYEIAIKTTTATEMAAILAAMKVSDPLTGETKAVWSHKRA